MSELIVDYLLFIGLGLYIFTSLTFLYLFLRTLRTVDGIGLFFLKLLTFGIFLGSATIALVRLGTMYFGLDSDAARAIAVVNPIVLLGVGSYLNFLFHQKYDK